jgi:hypothetical protein
MQQVGALLTSSWQYDVELMVIPVFTTGVGYDLDPTAEEYPKCKLLLLGTLEAAYLQN